MRFAAPLPEAFEKLLAVLRRRAGVPSGGREGVEGFGLEPLNAPE
jgi:hypothetical protein